LPPIIDVPGVPASTACDPAAPMSCNFDPAPGGRRYVDSDRDGLHDCEERQLGTDAFNPDTDGDGVTDDREIRAGLDPTAWDVDHDDDHDAVANGREVEWHLSPTVVQSEIQSRHRYRYERTLTGNALDGRPCYHFQVNGVRLMPTRRSSDLGPDAGAGYNDVTVHIVENIGGDLLGVPLVRTACIRARYVPPAFKAPRSGEVVLTEDDFRYLESRDPVISSLPSADRAQLLFDPETGCVELP
jgi:hypothetical protein